MAEHIFLPDHFRDIQAYTKKAQRISWTPPERDRASHGNRL
jgi:hypothetical protein